MFLAAIGIDGVIQQSRFEGGHGGTAVLQVEKNQPAVRGSRIARLPTRAVPQLRPEQIFGSVGLVGSDDMQRFKRRYIPGRHPNPFRE